ncbi:MAG TPA: hypothetical protein VIF88_02040 [Methylocystis sp.]
MTSTTTYTPEQLRKIVRAYVRGDEDDPALMEWRADNPDAAPYDDDGFLEAALEALGEKAYRRELLPFVAELDAYADEMENAFEYPFDVAELRAAIRQFEAWSLDGNDESSFDVRWLNGLIYTSDAVDDSIGEDRFHASLIPIAGKSGIILFERVRRLG